MSNDFLHTEDMSNVIHSTQTWTYCSLCKHNLWHYCRVSINHALAAPAMHGCLKSAMHQTSMQACTVT